MREIKPIISDSDSADILELMSNYLITGIKQYEAVEKTGKAFKKHKQYFDILSEKCQQGHSFSNSITEMNLFSKKTCKLIESGEKTGRLVEVITELVDVQRYISETVNETQNTFFSQIVTFALSVIVFPYIIHFISGTTQDKKLLIFSSYLNSIMDLIPFVEYLYPLLILFFFILLMFHRETQISILSVLKLIPYINFAIIYWQLGIWSSIMSLSLKSGLSFSVSEPLLREFLTGDLREAIKKINEDSVIHGWSGACDSQYWAEQDVRYILPDILLTYIISGSETGNLNVQLKKLSSAMLKVAKKRFVVLSKISFYLIMCLSAGLVTYLASVVLNTTSGILQ